MDDIKRHKIKGLMAEQGYNNTSLAKEMGVTRATMSGFMNGRAPSYPFMALLVKTLSMTPEQAGSIFFDCDLRIT